jgi:hypothetical protein
MEHKELDKHALPLGRLVGNLQSLEFALRAFLLNNEVALGMLSHIPRDPNKLTEGDIVPEDAFTNYDNLGELIEKYNHNPRVLAAGLIIDKSLIGVRDALAHGRISGDAPVPPLKLLKFDKPRNHKVKVTFSVLMTIEWFNEQISRVNKAITRVSEANERLHNGRL